MPINCRTPNFLYKNLWYNDLGNAGFREGIKSIINQIKLEYISNHKLQKVSKPEKKIKYIKFEPYLNSKTKNVFYTPYPVDCLLQKETIIQSLLKPE